MSVPLANPKPKWSRRKDARPAEIVEAALELFIEQGFSTTKIDDIARRAGVAKGTLYRYFATKEDLFRAAVRQTASDGLPVFAYAAPGVRFEEMVPVLLDRAASSLLESRVPTMLRMVLAESRMFPDLVTIWREEVIFPMLATISGLIEEAQEHGEVIQGDARLMALTIVGPMITGALFREVFWAADAHRLDLTALASTTAASALHGLLASKTQSQ